MYLSMYLCIYLCICHTHVWLTGSLHGSSSPCKVATHLLCQAQSSSPGAWASACWRGCWSRRTRTGRRCQHHFWEHQSRAETSAVGCTKLQVSKRRHLRTDCKAWSLLWIRRPGTSWASVPQRDQVVRCLAYPSHWALESSWHPLGFWQHSLRCNFGPSPWNLWRDCFVKKRQRFSNQGQKVLIWEKVWAIAFLAGASPRILKAGSRGFLKLAEGFETQRWREALVVSLENEWLQCLVRCSRACCW